MLSRTEFAKIADFIDLREDLMNTDKASRKSAQDSASRLSGLEVRAGALTGEVASIQSRVTQMADDLAPFVDLVNELQQGQNELVRRVDSLISQWNTLDPGALWQKVHNLTDQLGDSCKEVTDLRRQFELLCKLVPSDIMKAVTFFKTPDNLSKDTETEAKLDAMRKDIDRAVASMKQQGQRNDDSDAVKALTKRLRTLEEKLYRRSRSQDYSERAPAQRQNDLSVTSTGSGLPGYKLDSFTGQPILKKRSPSPGGLSPIMTPRGALRRDDSLPAIARTGSAGSGEFHREHDSGLLERRHSIDSMGKTKGGKNESMNLNSTSKVIIDNAREQPRLGIFGGGLNTTQPVNLPDTQARRVLR